MDDATMDTPEPVCVTVDLPPEMVRFDGAFAPIDIVLPDGTKVTVTDVLASIRVTMKHDRGTDDAPRAARTVMHAHDGKIDISTENIAPSGIVVSSDPATGKQSIEFMEQLLRIVQFGAGLSSKVVMVK